MTKELSSFGDHAEISMQSNVAGTETVGIEGYYHVVCRDAEGNVKWEDGFPNLVNAVGKQLMLDTLLSGSAYTTVGPFLGLISGASPTFAAADTMTSHAGWTEIVPYSNATRPACTFGTATTADPSIITNSASPAAFTINATATVGGAFLTSNNTKSGTTGILFSASDFAAPGDRVVASGDTLNVTYTFSLDAA